MMRQILALLMVFPSAVSVWETIFSSEENGAGGARARPEDIPAQTSGDVEVRQALGEVDLLRRGSETYRMRRKNQTSHSSFRGLVSVYHLQRVLHIRGLLFVAQHVSTI